jgi:hypothetical protein
MFSTTRFSRQEAPQTQPEAEAPKMIKGAYNIRKPIPVPQPEIVNKSLWRKHKLTICSLLLLGAFTFKTWGMIGKDRPKIQKTTPK